MAAERVASMQINHLQRLVSNSGWLRIRWLIRYVSTHDFTVFAWYRIRVWGGGAVDGVYGVGGVERVKSGHLIRSNFLRDFGFYYELLPRPDRKYYSHE